MATGRVTIGSGSGTITVRATNPAGQYTDTTCAVTVQDASGWQLASGHYIASKMAATIIHPRPMAETLAWERHRRAPSGIAWRCPVVVRGGSWPFRYSLVTGPAGMTIGETLPSDWLTNGLQNYGVLRWDSPTVGNHTVTVRVECQDGTNPSDVTWTLEVASREDTTRFLFVNAAAAGGGTGSYSSPFNSIAQWYGAARDSTEYQYRQVFYYTGTYTFPALALQSDAKYDFKSAKPLVHVAIPGQAVTWDLQNAGMMDNNGSGAGFCFSGLRIANFRHLAPGAAYRKSAIRMAYGASTARDLFFENTFLGGGATSSVDGTNSSPIMYGTAQGSGTAYYHAIVSNTFDGCYDTDMVLCYDACELVFEGNRITGGMGRVQNGGWGVYIKGANNAAVGQQYYSVRANVGIEGTITRPLIRTDSSGLPANIEVCWNSWKASFETGFGHPYYGAGYVAIGNWNSSGGAGAHWFYRNSANIAYEAPTNMQYGTWLFQNDVWQHDGRYTDGWQPTNCIASLTDPSSRQNLLTATSGLLNATTNLLEPAYAAYRGTHGCEVA